MKELINTLVHFGVLSKTFDSHWNIFEYALMSSGFKLQVYDINFGDWLDICSIEKDDLGDFYANTALTDDSYVELTMDNFLILEIVKPRDLVAALQNIRAMPVAQLTLPELLSVE